MDTVRLSVEERELSGKGPARRLRAGGRLPGVLYGKGMSPRSIVVGVEDLKAALSHGHNVVLELDLGKPAKAAKGKGKTGAQYAVIKAIQVHPTKRYPLSVDLHAVDLAVEIESPVAIELVGTPAGLRDGGIVDWEHREVTVRALPSSMPQAVELDVSGLEIGHHLTVAALTAPEGTAIIDDPDTIVVTLVPPRVEQPTAAEAEEAAEPEVVGETKSEE
jgi:large subunit ribosomal protein L25